MKVKRCFLEWSLVSRRFAVTLTFVLGGGMLLAANLVPLKGVVKDASGEPLAGVTVRIKDGKSGTITDVNGHFVLDVEKGKKLLLSYIGYSETEVLVKVGYGSKMGEGWLLTAEMIELADTGYENIVCTQPFGCLPNHINGKGAIRKIKEIRPNANIVTIDYDPGAPKVNQENRIKLMLAVGKEELKKKLEAEKNGEKAESSEKSEKK